MDTKPFGVDGDLNVRIIDQHIPVEFLERDEKRYEQNCGTVFDTRFRPAYKNLYLCNTANLNGDSFEKALLNFHQMVDEHIDNYWMDLTKNVLDKIGKSLLTAIALIALSTCVMWVIKGDIA